MADSLGQRMKDNYEDPYRIKLTRRTPVIVRLDGRAFHTLTKKCKKPFDDGFIVCMELAAVKLYDEVQNCKMAYIQSDEISLLLVDYARLNTCAWFDNNLQKIVSVTASICSVEFTSHFGKPGCFDARAFTIPSDEVTNYFIWRQKDWERNSVLMLAQSLYSQKELHLKKQADMHEMIYAKGLNWNNLTPKQKNGSVMSYGVLEPAPVFTQNREYIETLLQKEE